jgi:hypothetical protein
VLTSTVVALVLAGNGWAAWAVPWLAWQRELLRASPS